MVAFVLMQRQEDHLTVALVEGGVPPPNASEPVRTQRVVHILAGALLVRTCPWKTGILANEPSSVLY